jgi:hypothetical protein
MRLNAAWIVSVCLINASALALIPDDEEIMRRGDANMDGVVNLSDAVYVNGYLYSGGPAPPCMNQADVNNDGHVDGSDSVYLLNWLYNGGPVPPSPGPTNTTCAAEDSPYPGCGTSPCS